MKMQLSHKMGYLMPLDLIPLTPPTPFTRLIERQGKVLL
jgi:hypothetical protein